MTGAKPVFGALLAAIGLLIVWLWFTNRLANAWKAIEGSAGTQAGSGAGSGLGSGVVPSSTSFTPTLPLPSIYTPPGGWSVPSVGSQVFGTQNRTSYSAGAYTAGTAIDPELLAAIGTRYEQQAAA
jgi:hypothetical protein